ncbi:MAG: hypothetical protein [Microvirus sp.]|nr:MAG: hypothetical protein [Microvirus sp.]
MLHSEYPTGSFVLIDYIDAVTGEVFPNMIPLSYEQWLFRVGVNNVT